MGLSLLKGQPDALDDNGTPITKLFVGVGWDQGGGDQKGFKARLRSKKGVDLDLACIVLDREGNGVRVCGFNDLTLYGGALVHTGDNRTGKGDGLDESIAVDLTKIQSNIKTLVFVLNAFKKGVSFADIAGADYFVYHGGSEEGEELGVSSVPIDDATKTTIVIARVVRQDDGSWTHTILNDRTNVNGIQGLLSAGRQYAG